MRAPLVALLLLIALIPLPSAAAALPYLDFDVQDPRDDVIYTGEATSYEVSRPGMDVVRLTADVQGGQVVQTLTFAAEPEPGLLVEFIDFLAEGASGQLRFQVPYDQQGQVPETVEGQLITTSAMGNVPISLDSSGTTLTMTFDAAQLPDDIACFQPWANPRMGNDFAEWVEIRVDTCDYVEVTTDGLSGTCPPPQDSARALVASESDPRGDVLTQDSETLQERPREAPGLDIVGYEARREDARIVQEIQLDESLRNASVTLRVAHSLGQEEVAQEFVTSFGRLLPDFAEGTFQSQAFPVFFQREGDRITLSFCESILPPEIPCVYTEIQLSSYAGDPPVLYTDHLTLGQEACMNGEFSGGTDGPATGAEGEGDTPDGGSTSGGTGVSEDGSFTGDEGEDPTAGGEFADTEGDVQNDAPAPGLIAALVALAALALARRRPA